MPFDVLSGQTNTRLGVRDAVAQLGIEPISGALLEAYKQEQLRKHPGSFLYRHRVKVVSILGIATLVMMIGAVPLTAMALVTMTSRHGLLSLWCLVGAGVLICGSLSLVNGAPSIKITKPAIWRLEWVGSQHRIPTEIASITNEILKASPGSRAVIGLLVQEKTVLDPFIEVRDTVGHSVVIGIWDDTGILHIAKRH